MPIMNFPFGRNATTDRSCAVGPFEKYQAPTIGEDGSTSLGIANEPSPGTVAIRVVLVANAVVPGAVAHEVEPNGAVAPTPHSC